ncbi:MAG TPA: AI-2E family transporter [Candidatus Saccharimonadales bacterium]|nr:AI-2E family transporter [Candidatus Saccharimonadales bacterium]
MLKFFKKDEPTQIELTISNRTVIRVLALVFGAILFLAALRQATTPLLLIASAFFLSLALNAPVHWIARHLPGKLEGKRTAATAIAFFLVILTIGAFLAIVVPPLIRQTQNFITAAPGLINDLRDGNSPIGGLVQRYQLQDEIDSFSSEVVERLQASSGAIIAGVGTVGSSVIAVVTILALTIMMLLEGPRILAFMRELIPDGQREHANRLASEMYRVIKGFINGQVILAGLAALVITPFFFMLGIGYPAALTAIVFICGLIPMVGATIGAVIVSLVALATSPVSALIIFLVYLLYQQIENYIIQPKIQANSTDMSPLLIFASVLIGVSFGGIFGGLFAIPIAGCIRIALLDYLKNHHYIADKPVVAEEVAKAGAK